MRKLLIIHPKQLGDHVDYLYYCKYLKDYFDITFLSPYQGLSESKIESIEIKYYYPKANHIINLAQFALFCLREIKSQSYDAVFVSYFKIAFILPLFCRQKKFIMDIRSGMLSEVKMITWLYNKWILFNSYFFIRVTVISDSLRDKLHLNKKKTAVLPLGAEAINSPKEFRHLNMLYVGTLNFRRIEDTVLGLKKFLEKISEAQASTTYDIVGYGTSENEKKLIDTINNSGLGSVVKFHGRVPHKNIDKFLVNSNIGICYIPMEDHFQCQPPTKLFEYVLSGSVCLATATIENSRFINSHNGVTCKDTPEDFAKGLTRIYLNLKNYNSNQIRHTLGDYRWRNIVLTKLKPLLD